MPLQQVLYRQMMYLVTIQSVITALLGTRHRWQAINRTGVFADEADAAPDDQWQPGAFGTIGT